MSLSIRTRLNGLILVILYRISNTFNLFFRDRGKVLHLTVLNIGNWCIIKCSKFCGSPLCVARSSTKSGTEIKIIIVL